MNVRISVLLCLCSFFGYGQSFTNGAMDGITNFENTPTGWSFIPYTDPACLAPTAAEATVDVVDSSGPNVSGGVAGVPNSFETFCSGLRAETAPNYFWHEGIMQEVSGLVPGETYTLGFYQTVVKQTNCVDTSGSWSVYMDDQLIGTSTPSVSLLAANDIHFNWELRTMNFTPTMSTHTFKFIPEDDDGDAATSVSNLSGALRMGIDDIHFIWPNPPTVDLGNDTTLCFGEELLLNAGYPYATYLWNDGSTDSTLLVTAPGTYSVQVANLADTVTDEITVAYMGPPEVLLSLSMDSCIGNTAVMSFVTDNVTPVDTFFWSTGETETTIYTQQGGLYWVEVGNSCGSERDSVAFEFVDCTTVLEMPNVFSPNGDDINDRFVPTVYNMVMVPELVILNRWGNEVFRTEDIVTGWNGAINGEPASEGVYFWRLTYNDLSSNIIRLNGLVTLLR